MEEVFEFETQTKKNARKNENKIHKITHRCHRRHCALRTCGAVPAINTRMLAGVNPGHGNPESARVTVMKKYAAVPSRQEQASSRSQRTRSGGGGGARQTILPE